MIQSSVTVSHVKVRCLSYVHICTEQTRAEAGGKLASTQIINFMRSVTHTRSRSGGGAGAKSAPQHPKNWVYFPLQLRNHVLQTIFSFCPQEMADPPASAPPMCEHTCGNGAGMSKSTRLRSSTAPRICERNIRLAGNLRLAGNPIVRISDTLIFDINIRYY